MSARHPEALFARLRFLDTRWILLAIVALALVLRVAFVLSLPDERMFGDADDYWFCSENLVQGNGFSLQPYDGRWAHVPPFYPLFLAGLKAIGISSLLGLRLAQVLLAVVPIPLFYYLGRSVLPVKVVIVGALLYAISPHMVYWPGMISTEILAIVLFTVSYLAFAHGIEKDRDSWLALSTVLLGTAVLTRSVFVLVFPIFLLGIYLRGAHRLRRIAGLSTLLLLILLPWTIRNYVLFDHLVPVTIGNGRMQVYRMIGFSEDYRDVMDRNQAAFELHHERYMHPATPAEEYDADRELLRIASEMRWAHPATTARLWGYNLLRFWSPGVTLFAERLEPAKFFPSLLFGGLLFPFAAVGLRELARRNRNLFIVTGLILLYFTALHSLLIGILRYRMVLDAILYLLAVLGAVRLLDRMRLHERT